MTRFSRRVIWCGVTKKGRGSRQKFPRPFSHNCLSLPLHTLLSNILVGDDPMITDPLDDLTRADRMPTTDDTRQPSDRQPEPQPLAIRGPQSFWINTCVIDVYGPIIGAHGFAVYSYLVCGVTKSSNEAIAAFSNEAIAAFFHMSPKKVTATLKKLQDVGLIDLVGGEIVIIDLVEVDQ